ncbi:hypothetical protein AB0B25_02330 [Nocardia sp. NPDC049190]|uniref:hypothetical protein n=1 Tax=Nocardia sp. NPDC049190 TaxID=3155650 RepID=UPI0033C7C348
MKKLLGHAAKVLGALLVGAFGFASGQRPARDVVVTFPAPLTARRPSSRTTMVRQCVPARHTMVRRRHGTGPA